METAERIPDDIDRSATDLVRARYEDDAEWNMYLAIARALLAERERCARIAEDIDCDPKHDGIVVEIAAAIRS